MKPESALQTLTLFFNDIIGAIIPGAVLLSGLLIIHVNEIEKQKMEISNAFWIIALLFTFAAGHLLLSFHSKFLEKPLAWLSNFKYTKKLGLKTINEIQATVEEGAAYKTFRVAIDERILLQGGSSESSVSTWKFNDLRSLAMSISMEASAVARRFMFIGLLCLGVGSALVVLLLDCLICNIFFSDNLANYKNAPPLMLQTALLLISIWLCFMRGTEFYRRALSTPFSVAYAALYFSEKKEKNDGKA